MNHHLDRSFTANSTAITPIAAYSTIIIAFKNLHLKSMMTSAIIVNFFAPLSQTITKVFSLAKITLLLPLTAVTIINQSH